ncbi:uncharacterized protein LOC131356254 [Hemibagrus wyckioides]|uniref:uncharacterized protein LOC131356254 n=1 Tax=Hemibagrus wyckioides TaxID=337641 RepID=UPI00266BCC7D|nr:uncharacterized protein LOC131356254 [Hemibagrus wyckioides]
MDCSNYSMGMTFLCMSLLLVFSFLGSQAERLKVAGPDAPVFAVAGEDLVLPCFIKPSASAVDMRVEWFRLDAEDSLVHLYKDQKDNNEKQAQSYRGRTSLFKEELQKGNASLKLSALRFSDEGEYKCLVEDKSWYDDITVKVTVKVLGSRPVIRMESFDNSGGINLVCESRGWKPEPEVLWLDREGVTLPAEDTQIHRDTEGFNVKRSITVYDSSDSNRFYCRLQQKDHLMETDIIINSEVFAAWKIAVISIFLLVLLTTAGFILTITCAYQKTAIQRIMEKQEIQRKILENDFEMEKQYADIQRKLLADQFEKKMKYTVDVTLDPDTAHPKLILSEDGKQVTHEDKCQDLPDTPERFDYSPCVLGKQSFSSVRFYYEVQVRGKTAWDVGVAKESINRKGKITLNPQNGFWAVVLRNENQYRACAGPAVSLTLREKVEVVGVFVDYEEGLVSFYDVTSRYHIYSFTGQSFTEKLYPFFSPCNNKKGLNVSPLIIAWKLSIMASSSSFLSEEHLLCSICLDVFTHPVTTPCGHNFCKKCLAGYWDSSDHYQCPLCNKSFEMRPDMSINTLISETAVQFKQSVQRNTASTSEKNACASTKVLCDACTGVKRSSVKSCLNCGASYCEIHLQPHKTIQNLKKHKLINPVENLEDYICQKHERPLELFCRDDETCLCQFCIEGDHKNHNTVPIEEANEELKACLKKTQTEVQQMIQERLEKTEEIERSLQISKKSTEEEISQGVEVFTALIRSIEKSQAELLEVMEEKQKAAESQAEGLIKELEQEITVLKRKDLQLNQLSDAKNYLQKIQIYSSMSSPPHTKNWTEISMNTDLSKKTLQKSLSHLHKELNSEMDKEMQKLKQMNRHKAEALKSILLYLVLLAPFLIPAMKPVWIQIYAVNVTLDPDTANRYLILSQDGKQVRSEPHSWKSVPYNQKRFNEPYVLAKEGFSSGRFYYEVQVTGKTEWDLGVARESVSRYGPFYSNHNDGIWSMIKRNGKDYLACAGSCVRLSLREKMEKVGVFVDYEEGLVSFYDAKARSHIYSITGQSFTEKLNPLFSPGFNFNNDNSAPLIICDVYEYLNTLRNFFPRAAIWQWF